MPDYINFRKTIYFSNFLQLFRNPFGNFVFFIERWTIYDVVSFIPLAETGIMIKKYFADIDEDGKNNEYTVSVMNGD